MLDHLQELHALLVKDTLPDDYLGLFRKEGIEIINYLTGEVYDSIKILDFDFQIENLKIQKNHFQGLDALAFEHIALLKIHPFYDGNGRLARFILCRRLEAMGGKYFYKYLETRNDDYKRVINQLFHEKKTTRFFFFFSKKNYDFLDLQKNARHLGGLFFVGSCFWLIAQTTQKREEFFKVSFF